MGICSCTVKFILFVFNLICALAGLAVMGVGIWAYLQNNKLSDIMDGHVSGTVITMMVFGGITFIIAFLGCCGAVKEDPCFITTYAVILTIILIGQLIVAGIAVYFFSKTSVQDQLKKSLEEAFNEYNKDHTKEAKYIDAIQQQFRCCGYDGKSGMPGKLPPSCCDNPSSVGNECPRDQAFDRGCKDPILATITKVLKTSAITLFVIVGIELLCIICAFCVSSSIRREAMRSGYSY